MDVLFYSEKDLFLRPCGSRGLLPSTHILHSNGLAPDNLFFHGVACNCVKIQLAHLGLETEFAQCEIQVKGNVRLCFGRWQEELPKLIAEGLEFDGIFYDTYGEHFTDLEDFHGLMTRVLHKPGGIYSFL